MCNESNNASEPQASIVPSFDEIVLVLMEDDEWEGVDEREDKHGPADPSVPDIKLLVRNTSQSRDKIGLGTKNQNKW